MYAYERRDSAQERILVVLNLSDQKRDDYQLEVPNTGHADVLLYTDWDRFSGHTPDGSADVHLDERAGTVTCSLAPFSGIMLEL